MSSQSSHGAAVRMTADSLRALKKTGRPIVMITAYDYHGARLVDAAGVDAILVGDSLGMTVLGHPSTLQVTMDDMVAATAAVSRGAGRALVVADMPFMSYQASPDDAVANAGRLLSQGGASAVKVEGASPEVLAVVTRMIGAGIPVMGHVGLTPQSVNTLGGYKTQAKESASAAKLIDDCRALEQAGAFSIVLECIPSELAERVSALVDVPTIGIGAGAGCDGQVQVFHDLLGIGDFTPRHAKRYADLDRIIAEAVTAYADDVRDRVFPADAQSTHADPAMVDEAERASGALRTRFSGSTR